MSIRIPQDTIDELDILSEYKGTPKSTLVTKFIHEGIFNMMCSELIELNQSFRELVTTYGFDALKDHQFKLYLQLNLITGRALFHGYKKSEPSPQNTVRIFNFEFQSPLAPEDFTTYISKPSNHFILLQYLITIRTNFLLKTKSRNISGNTNFDASYDYNFIELGKKLIQFLLSIESDQSEICDSMSLEEYLGNNLQQINHFYHVKNEPLFHASFLQPNNYAEVNNFIWTHLLLRDIKITSSSSNPYDIIIRNFSQPNLTNYNNLP